MYRLLLTPKEVEKLKGLKEHSENNTTFDFYVNREAAAELRRLRDSELISTGGRVLTVTGTGSDLTEARDKAYRSISQIRLDKSFYRSDIALNASVAEKGN
jgi:phosphoribosylamine-glycine ligase